MLLNVLSSEYNVLNKRSYSNTALKQIYNTNVKESASGFTEITLDAKAKNQVALHKVRVI